MDPITRWLLGLIDEAFEGPAWHGPSLSATLRGLSAEQAIWRPAPGRNSAWAIVLHLAYWKHRVHERVAPGTVEPFPRGPRDWPQLPAELTPAAWKADLALLKQTHAELRAAVLSLPASRLKRPGPGQKQTRLQNLVGSACHDLYHGGQIRLLRRIQESAAAGRRGRTGGRA